MYFFLIKKITVCYDLFKSSFNKKLNMKTNRIIFLIDFEKKNLLNIPIHILMRKVRLKKSCFRPVKEQFQQINNKLYICAVHILT